jgi:RHS repeat-associated protein
MTEASGSAFERLTAYTPHAVFDKPEYITVKSADTPSQNKITEIGYDEDNGDALFISLKGYADGQYGIRTITFEEYTPHGQIKQINGPRTDVNDITVFEYHSDTDTNIFNRGMLYRIVNALGQTIEFGDYNHFGRPERMRDVCNVETFFNYDVRGRQTGKTVNGKTTAYTYDKTGNLKTVTPPGLKGSVTFDYTPANLAEYVHDQLGNHLKFGYDNESNLLSEENYNSGSVMKRYAHYEYNEFNRLWKIISPDGTFALIETDENGNVTGFADAENRTTQFVYDNLNRLMTRVQPGNVTTTYQHDAHDNSAKVTDAENTVTNYDYDDFGGLRTLSSPDTGDVTYDYDVAGNLKSKTDANQVTTYYDYDVLNRLTGISYNPPDASQNIGFGYDEPQALYGKGRLTSVSDVAGGTSYQYDARGFITQETRKTDNVTYITHYVYNDRGNLETVTYPTGSVITYPRHDNERVSGILVNGQILTQNVTYMPFGPEEDFVFGDNILSVDRKYYDNYYRLENIDAQVLNYHYQYYADDNVKTIDGLPIPGVSDGQTDYQKFPAGNRLNHITKPDNTVYDYVYDNNGNITSDGVFTYRYNQNNRLIEEKQGSSVIAEYFYDAFERRVKKTVSGTVTHFHYDQECNLISETAGNGSSLRDYIYQNGNLIAIKLYGDQAGLYYVISDHLGTPRQIVNFSGAVVWKAAYLPFGKAQVLVETITNNIRFKGQYFDVETGLHYNCQRYYDPSTGRYLRADPIGLVGGINLYAYCQNDPVNCIDPWGLWPLGLPGKRDALKNGSFWVDYYLPGLNKSQQQKIVNEVVDELGWKDVKDGLIEFGSNFLPPIPDKVKDLTADQKKIIENFFNRTDDIPVDIKNRICDLLNSVNNESETCPK